jgi:hypothetical protein
MITTLANYPGKPLEAKNRVAGYAYDAVFLAEGAFQCGTPLAVLPDGTAAAWKAESTETVTDEKLDVPNIEIAMPELEEGADDLALKNAAGSTTFVENTDYKFKDQGAKIELLAGGDAIKESSLLLTYTIPGDPDPTPGSKSLTVPNNVIDLPLPAGGTLSEVTLSDGSGNNYTATTDYTYSSGKLTIVSGGGAAGAESVYISGTLTIDLGDPAGLLASPVREIDSRQAPMMIRGYAYASQVPGYDASLAAAMPNITFINDLPAESDEEPAGE